METSKLILCDTDILIEFFRNNHSIIERLDQIGEEHIFISTVTVCEIYYGALNKRDLGILERKLNDLVQIPLHDKICEIAENLVLTYCLSHRLAVPDALIAGTAIYYDLPLFTRNKKDFRHITSLMLLD